MDKSIKLDVDFGVDRIKDTKAPSNARIMLQYIGYTVGLGYKEGLSSDKRRMWDAILRRIEDAVEKGLDSFTLNQYEYVFIKQAYEKAVAPANEVKWVTASETAVLNAEDVQKA